jgi:hypothetical protein
VAQTSCPVLGSLIRCVCVKVTSAREERKADRDSAQCIVWLFRTNHAEQCSPSSFRRSHAVRQAFPAKPLLERSPNRSLSFLATVLSR